MKTVFVNTNIEKKALLLQSLCNLLDKKILIVNTEEKSRQIEYALGVEDFCVYDNLDVLSKVVDYKKAMVEVKSKIYIIPSSIKPEKFTPEKEDYIKLLDELEDFDMVIFTTNVGIKYDEEIVWGDFEEADSEKKFQILDSTSKLNKNFKYIGKIEFTDDLKKKINSYTEETDSKIEEIIDNYLNEKEIKLGFFDRIFRR